MKEAIRKFANNFMMSALPFGADRSERLRSLEYQQECGVQRGRYSGEWRCECLFGDEQPAG